MSKEKNIQEYSQQQEILNEELIFAAGGADFNRFKEAFNDGGDINAVNEYGNTVLHEVCWNDNPCSFEMIEFIFARGADADINKANVIMGNMPLHNAGQNEGVHSLDIIKFLIENGANINARNSDNETVLHFVCRGESQYILETMEFLIERGIDQTFFAEILGVSDITGEAINAIDFLKSKGEITCSETKNEPIVDDYISATEEDQANDINIAGKVEEEIEHFS